MGLFGKSKKERETEYMSRLDVPSANVASVIVAGLGVAVPLVLVWFAFRFIYRKAKVALKRGA